MVYWMTLNGIKVFKACIWLGDLFSEHSHTLISLISEWLSTLYV